MTEELSCLRSALTADLSAIRAYLVENDAGVRGDPCGRRDLAELAWANAEVSAAGVSTLQDAHLAIRQYIRAWRAEHLGVIDERLRGVPKAAPMPSFEALSSTTILIRLPSFDSSCAQPLKDLLQRHRADLESHPCWILDVRGGGGGNDYVYAPLLDWLMPREWVVIGTEFLATPANADAHERVARQSGIDPGAVSTLERLVATIRKAATGDYVRLEEESAGVVIKRPAPFDGKRPSSVGVLVDARVGSSSEEFLLEIRTSPLVRIYGQPTAGNLDYSNLRPWPLPSGRRTLWYATSRSLRLPSDPIDGIGVVPHHVLPAPSSAAEAKAEVDSVRKMMESSR